MLKFSLRLGLALLTCLQLCVVHSSSAVSFSLKTHLWVAQTILEDVKVDCAVRILDEQYALTSEVCAALRNHPTAFLSGALGPDIYPDVVVGQTTTHPGIQGGWQTDQWLAHTVRSASSPDQLAFAYGYLVHAATDIFAHTYVNNYSGDVFALGDERAVERRHFVLEKYIDERLPSPAPDAKTMTVPVDWARDTFVFNNDAVAQYRRTSYAAHLVGMHEVRRSVRESAKHLEEVEKTATALVARYIAEALDLSARYAMGEVQLQVAREALRLQELQLAEQRRAVDLAEREVNRLLGEIARQEQLIASLTRTAETLRNQARLAREAAAEAAQQVSTINREINNLQARLATTPTHVAQRHCDPVVRSECERHCPGGRLNPICRNVCRTVTHEVCNTVEVVNQEWSRLTQELTNARNRLSTAQAEATRYGAMALESAASESAALQEKAQRESTVAALRTAKVASDLTFNTAKTSLEVQLATTQKAREAIENLEREVENLRSQLVDKQTIKATIQAVLNDANFLSFFFRNWSTGIDRAGSSYIETSLELSKNMISGESKAFELYKEWLSCHGTVFTATPYQLAEGGCNLETEYQRAQERIDQMLQRVLPEVVADLIDKINALKAHIRDELAKALEKAGIELVKFVTDPTTGDFVDLLANPQNATAAKLNEVFNVGGDAGGKQLLVFAKISDLIDLDIGLLEERLSLDVFKSLQYAITLSKLSLMQPGELNRMVRRVSAAPNMPDVFTVSPGKYSVLFDSVRSIDGNHQWQPFGLPYPRQTGAPEPYDGNHRHFGYGPLDGPGKGFKIFIDSSLRRTVFLRLFPEPVAGSIQQLPQLKPPTYPFPACSSNPFPLSFDKNGQPAIADDSCPK